MTHSPLVDLLATAIENRSARGIATAINREIRSGRLSPGERLPTVRELAGALQTSPTTVSEAWQLLGRSGTIDARGRNGTFVRSERRPQGPRRYRSAVSRTAVRIDLSAGIPDPDLLPDMRPALARVSRRNLTTSYLDAPVLPALAEVLEDRWPFRPELLTVVDGAMDALDRLGGALFRLGDRVLVEDPGFPPILDLVEQLGATPIGIALDEEGLVPSALAEALHHDPVALVLQPRAQNPTGVSMTRARALELAEVLADTQLLVIEDDHSGDIAWSDPVSLGTFLPDRTVHIRSFSKSHGPDLRLAAVGGAGSLVTEVIERRILGPGWSSRLLQAVLLEMLRDGGTVDAVAAARLEYRRRRQDMTGLLRARAVRTYGSDGINLWLDVDDEDLAIMRLQFAGIGASPGAPFWCGSRATPGNLRVTVGALSDEREHVADALAAAARL